jgi:hypothetical protein
MISPMRAASHATSPNGCAHNILKSVFHKDLFEKTSLRVVSRRKSAPQGASHRFSSPPQLWVERGEFQDT